MGIKCQIYGLRGECAKGPKTRHKCQSEHTSGTPHTCKHCGERFGV